MDASITECTLINGPDAEQIRAILVEAFPPAELEPFEDFIEDVHEGSRRLLLARTGERVAGLAAIRLLPDVYAAILEYLATDRVVRNRGVGAQLLRAAVSALRKGGPLAGMVIEVERDDEGSPEERLVRARRIGFYARNGALPLAAVTNYRMPSMIGGDPVPMKLLWLPLAAGVAIAAGDDLRRLVCSLYRDGYGLELDDPLVQVALASIVAPSEQP